MAKEAEIIKKWKVKDPYKIDLAGRRHTLTLFHRVSKRVPAYKDFLKKHRIDPEKIRNWNDFQNVPPINKKNYLLHYPLPLRCWNGNLKNPIVFTSTSGSTGHPVYFPRNNKLDWRYSVILENYLRQQEKEETLVLICFGMGVWIGGLITYQAFQIASQRLKYPLSILTPGINKSEILKSLELLAPNFKQVIIVGYAPFIKDVLNEADHEKISLKNNFRFLFAAEAISEDYRDFLGSTVPIRNIYLDTMNIYGSADIGAMAFEGATAIMVKRATRKSKKIFGEIFSTISKTPTIAQFDPEFTQFEAVDGEILLSGDNEVPLLRYVIGDNGGVVSYSQVERIFENNGLSFDEELKKADIKRFGLKLPFVYVYERSDFSTALYGINIYPEYVREALLSKRISRSVTGKFTLITKFNNKQDQYLEVNIELQKGTKNNAALKKLCERIMHGRLLERSSEYQELTKFVKNRSLLRVLLWPPEYPKFFKPGVKQRWVIK